MDNVAGIFWFSPERRILCDKKKERRKFCWLLHEKRIAEYTEMAPISTLQEEPDYEPLYDDSVYLGEGWIHSLGKQRGR